ncbi:hypothetical protein ETI11_02605 [Macrococcoides canis]|uniref:DUF7878 domain-containing protein n=2 Tax=Macrococcoides canis TaxID=1855823 RepID=A0A4R6C7C3_9STAP|nr:hypothetical protein [Macrococcus canis]TDM18354.1 hypothetical protein ETI04_02355 [Macrococcus canis]TDM23528.1 hypothetical protein ETI02_03755 [Macrococcus canis]TDM38303.1 hypothetical protein ETI11_02605 [Macrococcus canis]
MALDANLKIKYKNTIYFDEDIAIIEFWLQLNNWLNGSSNYEFQYHTMEVEDEFNPLISISPKDECYQITSPFLESEISLIDYKPGIDKKLLQLRDNMRVVIEQYIQKDISIYEVNTIEKIIKKIIEVD